MSDPVYPDALPALSRLHWYVVERVLGQGGFGITYLARDTNLDQRVAIKEYLPLEVATRQQDATVRSRNEENRERYRWGLERFIQEARTLARFDHPNIMSVVVKTAADSCTYLGSYSQGGHFGHVSGGYACVSGDSGTFAMDEMAVSWYDFRARTVLSSDTGCILKGLVSGLRQPPPPQ